MELAVLSARVRAAGAVGRARPAHGPRKPPVPWTRRSWPALPRLRPAATERSRPELTAFFGCLYYAALRPEEAIACAMLTAICPPQAGGSSPSPGPHRAPPRPGPATAPRPTSGCSPEAGAGCSARVPTAGPGSRPAPALSPATAATGLARRPCDLRHATLWLWLNAGARPPRSPPAPGTASPSCSPLTLTASTARTRSPTARSSMPSTLRTGGQTGHPAVPRTAGPASILSAICPPAAPITRRGPPADPSARVGTRPGRIRQDKSLRRSEANCRSAGQREDLAHAWPTEHSRRSA
jgi:hypothetical protein